MQRAKLNGVRMQRDTDVIKVILFTAKFILDVSEAIAVKCGFYVTTGEDQLSGWTEKNLQSTSQRQT